jgi:hypothetical protein
MMHAVLIIMVIFGVLLVVYGLGYEWLHRDDEYDYEAEWARWARSLSERCDR